MYDIIVFDRDRRLFSIRNSDAEVDTLSWRALYQRVLNDYLFSVTSYSNCDLYDITVEEKQLSDKEYKVSIPRITKGVSDNDDADTVVISDKLRYEQRCGVLCRDVLVTCNNKQVTTDLLIFDYELGGILMSLVAYIKDTDSISSGEIIVNTDNLSDMFTDLVINEECIECIK